MRDRPSLPRALLLTSIAILPAVAGCLGSAEATAMGAREVADEAARAWSEDAALVKVIGVEGSFDPSRAAGSAADGKPDEWSRAAEDGKVGDGRCEIWVYRYFSPSKDRAYVVVVDRDQEIVRTGAEPRRSGDRALADWELDSDRALEIAKEANDGIENGVASERYGVLASLYMDGEGPRWFVIGGGGDATGGGGGLVVLDASTGEVLTSTGAFSRR